MYFSIKLIYTPWNRSHRQYLTWLLQTQILKEPIFMKPGMNAMPLKAIPKPPFLIDYKH
jgi:hypothetical protein